MLAQLAIRDRSIVDKLNSLGIKSLTSPTPRESISYGAGLQPYYYARKDITNIFAFCEVIIKKERVTREMLSCSSSRFFNSNFNCQGDIPDDNKPCEKAVVSLRP